MALIQLLVHNKIPLVLHLNQTESEIYLYVSQEVGVNIIKPLFKKKHQLRHFICPTSQQERVKNKEFTIITHLCYNYDTMVIIVVVHGSTLPSLNVDSSHTKAVRYFGIKNNKIRNYSPTKHSQIMKKYLL